ncbi:unnamed protein product [Notodromas monacha]|uniref:Histone deacetylase n=1 Tax=Notodromas monacha TaxID=399045 RepID=A0A7R9BYV9_9CRUS|nr:unnamed protein product [Notodromas monacha]CAG0923366.1 unnamed protein product [Notodromas monacha]
MEEDKPSDATLPRVAYFQHEDIGLFHYGREHPMKPFRIRMADSLVRSYGLLDLKNITVHNTPTASRDDLTRFHDADYVRFLETAEQEAEEEPSSRARFNIDEDCPVFPGMYDFCLLSAGGSIAGARLLNRGKKYGSHICDSASGFCYVNDIVLGILELLRVYKRVLYVDIDVHHGDGVEEAFYTTDRVMTLSLHKFGNFFPYSGDAGDAGAGSGVGYALNAPLHDGMDDASYVALVAPLLRQVMTHFAPDAVVLQCGADSLSQDWLGTFNLTLKGHGFCVDFFRRQGVPLLLLGGGGYTISNVARCWTWETAVALLGAEEASEMLLEDGGTVPRTDPYVDYYLPDLSLRVDATNRPNLNSAEYLDYLRVRFGEALRNLPHRPSVQLGQDVSKIAAEARVSSNCRQMKTGRKTVEDGLPEWLTTLWDVDSNDKDRADRQRQRGDRPTVFSVVPDNAYLNSLTSYFSTPLFASSTVRP